MAQETKQPSPTTEKKVDSGSTSKSTSPGRKKTKGAASTKSGGKTRTASPPPKEPTTADPAQSTSPAPAPESAGTDPGEKAREVLRETTETIGTGARIVGEKAGQLAGQVLGFLKKGLTEATRVGEKVVEEISHTATTYAEKYKHMAEMGKLNNRKRELFQELGQTLYEQVGHDPAALGKAMEQERVQNLLRNLEALDRQIVELGQQLDTGSKEKTE